MQATTDPAALRMTLSEELDYVQAVKHSTIKTTPAVKTGLADSMWTMEKLLTMASAA